MTEHDHSYPSELLGEPIRSIEPCRWGFSNQTAIVTLASGRRIIAQHLNNAAQAAELLRLNRDLPPLLATAQINAPQLLAADLNTKPPLLIRSYLPGQTANILLETEQSATSLAKHMGAIVGHLASLPIPDWLAATWAHPTTLGQAATAWLTSTASYITTDQAQILQQQIRTLAASWPDLPATVAHGDFCPVNAITEHGQITGIVDLEWARVASAAFDVAWWGWVVRYHHPERWQHTWPILLAAAGIPNTAPMQQHILALQQLRCLELLADALHSGRHQAAQLWQRRLEETVGALSG